MVYYKRFHTIILILLGVVVLAIAHYSMLYASHKPKHLYTRIISLSPSITAMIIDLESEHLLVGVTRYHPPLSKPIPIVGNINNPNVEQIIALKPDVVLASFEDAATQKIEQLSHAKINVQLLPPAVSFEALCSNYRTIASIINKEKMAQTKLLHYNNIRQRLMHKGNATAIILLSSNPYIAVSGKSYISNIFADAGIVNYITNTPTRYPIIQQEYLLTSEVDFIIALFGEPLPGAIAHLKKIIHIPYQDIYLYTPSHYCNALKHITQVLAGTLQ
ncbi:MAG: helical backbone metal receptor [Spirochaetes bacterium]|nr:helical backbone metal receptor [Spirochaetota bacterium]